MPQRDLKTSSNRYCGTQENEQGEYSSFRGTIDYNSVFKQISLKVFSHKHTWLSYGFNTVPGRDARSIEIWNCISRVLRRRFHFAHLSIIKQICGSQENDLIYST